MFRSIYSHKYPFNKKVAAVVFGVISLLVALVLTILFQFSISSPSEPIQVFEHYVEKREAYLQKEEALYTEHLELLNSLRALVHGDPTVAELDAWAEKMKDWEKRSKDVENEAPPIMSDKVRG